jgi:hypothetical protein
MSREWPGVERRRATIVIIDDSSPSGSEFRVPVEVLFIGVQYPNFPGCTWNISQPCRW